MYRFYFHGQRVDRDVRVLVESIVDKNTSKMQVTVKADDVQTPEEFKPLYQSILAAL